MSQTELFRIELPARVDTAVTIRFILPDGRLARATVPDVTQIPGWPVQRFIHVRVPKGAPRPPGLPPRPRHPSTILERASSRRHSKPTVRLLRRLLRTQWSSRRPR